MQNKYNRSIDPSKLNKYNKFLSSLDRTNTNTNTNTNNEDIIKEELQTQIDLIIEKIKTDFKNNHLKDSHFTGQRQNDIIMTNIDIKDPNYYQDNPTSYKLHLPKKVHTPEIKETIFIDTEINNIGDILKLIDTYKYDPSIHYNINMKGLHNIKEPLEELNNMIGMKNLKTNIVDQLLYFVQDLHKNKNTSGDFMHTVIYGPPGTGKTEIAKLMGKIYSKIGVLSNSTFKKVTRADLVAGYLGQTALKTKDIIKEALGGVLFIDEAYALGNAEKRDSFAKECIDTLCEALSDHKENLMVIIAGYETELKECFFNYNQGLDSRFTWRFKTDEYTADDLYLIFLKKVKDIGWEINEKSNIKVDWFKKNKEYFLFYGRDMETLLAKTKIAHSRRVFCKPENEKRNLIVIDLDKGFDMYISNEDVKNRKDKSNMKKYLYDTLYT